MWDPKVIGYRQVSNTGYVLGLAGDDVILEATKFQIQSIFCPSLLVPTVPLPILIMCKDSLHQILSLCSALFPTTCYNFSLGLNTWLLINCYSLIDPDCRFYLICQSILHTGTHVIWMYCSNGTPALLKDFQLLLIILRQLPCLFVFDRPTGPSTVWLGSSSSILPFTWSPFFSYYILACNSDLFSRII